jgi:hypothetical protein
MGSEGTLKIIGDRKRRKHNKNVEDNRDSITLVRVGNAGGHSGPLIFLAKGKTMDVPALKDLSKHGAPPHSTIIMTPSKLEFYFTNVLFFSLSDYQRPSTVVGYSYT